jgi:hypothetical protein
LLRKAKVALFTHGRISRAVRRICEIRDGTIAKLVDGDLFVIIRVAVEVIDEKLIQEPRINQSIREQWTEFKNTIIWMQRAQDASDTELILETYQRFKSSLMALEE